MTVGGAIHAERGSHFVAGKALKKYLARGAAKCSPSPKSRPATDYKLHKMSENKWVAIISTCSKNRMKCDVKISLCRNCIWFQFFWN